MEERELGDHASPLLISPPAHSTHVFSTHSARGACSARACVCALVDMFPRYCIPLTWHTREREKRPRSIQKHRSPYFHFDGIQRQKMLMAQPKWNSSQKDRRVFFSSFLQLSHSLILIREHKIRTLHLLSHLNFPFAPSPRWYTLWRYKTFKSQRIKIFCHTWRKSIMFSLHKLRIW